MTLPYRPSAVIFDMDGLLFDTDALWQEALLSAAAEGGHEVADELFSKSIGVPRSQCRASFLSHFGEDFLFDDFHANWVGHFWLLFSLFHFLADLAKLANLEGQTGVVCVRFVRMERSNIKGR